jgi:hypothetical protein
MLGQSEFALRQGFATQNACDAATRRRSQVSALQRAEAYSKKCLTFFDKLLIDRIAFLPYNVLATV